MDLAWHFTRNKLRDGSPIPKDGEWLNFDGKPKICVQGLHASRDIIDALKYALGNTVHRVMVNYIAHEQDDKLVASSRLILWRHEPSDDQLRAFARQCALSVIDLWDAPALVREYLETGNLELRTAAAEAARAASWTACIEAEGTAYAAAEGAAWAASELRGPQAARVARAVANAQTDAWWGGEGAGKLDKLGTSLERLIREGAGNPDDDALIKEFS